MMLRPAFAHLDTHYATTLAGLAEQSDARPAHRIKDCNRNTRGSIIVAAVGILFLLLRLRPDVVVTTGALPGYLTLFIARQLGMRTAWIDSVANAEEMSLAGQRAAAVSDLWMSQWPDVARATGAEYAGSVL